MNVHFIAWMSITFTFVLLGGGAYLLDTVFPFGWPHDSGLIAVWGHPPTHTRLAHALFFYGGLYAACNFVYHSFGLRRIRRDVGRAARLVEAGVGLASVVAASRARRGTSADKLMRLELGGDSAPHAFERAVSPRVREVGSGARALAAAAAVMLLAGSFAMVMECESAARGMALTGADYELETLAWIAATALEELATGMLIAVTCVFGFYVLHEGARDAARELEAVADASRRQRRGVDRGRS